MAHVTLTTFREPDLIRFGLQEILRDHPEFELVDGRHADVVLVDPFPPTERSVADALQRITLASRAGSAVVAFTARPSLRMKSIARKAGCDGVADKFWGSTELTTYLSSVVETPDRPEHVLPFDGRKQEIVELVAKGGTNRAIAKKINVSEETVKRDLEVVMADLDLSNRAHVAAWAAAHGLVSA